MAALVVTNESASPRLDKKVYSVKCLQRTELVVIIIKLCNNNILPNILDFLSKQKFAPFIPFIISLISHRLTPLFNFYINRKKVKDVHTTYKALTT